MEQGTESYGSMCRVLQGSIPAASEEIVGRLNTK